MRIRYSLIALTVLIAKVLALFFLPQQLCAAADPDQANRQADVLQQKQQEQIQQDQQKIQPVVPQNGADLNSLVPKNIKSAPDDGKCREIKSVDIKNSQHLSDAMRQKISGTFTGHCLNSEDINTILSWITRDYIEHGYVTTRAYFPAQDMSGSVLVIVVVEGTVEKIRVEDGGSKSISINNIFPGLTGQIFNLRDLEQGIDQVNRLQSNDVKADVQPGDALGQSIIVLRNSPKIPVHLIASYDNEGLVSTGRDQAAVTGAVDNLLGFNEFISASQRQSMPADSLTHFSNSSDFNAQIPFGYNTFGMDVNHSTYTDQLLLPAGIYLISAGTNTIQNVNASRLVYRDQKTRMLLSTSLTTKNSKNYLAEQLLTASSQKLTVWDSKASLTTNLNGNIIGLNLKYSRGLATMGAMDDSSYLPDNQPHAQFQKGTLEFDAKVPFKLNNTDFSYDLALTVQRSLNPLYGSEQILIGSLYTVRGFVNNTLAGDNGYFARNELSTMKSFDLGTQTILTRFYVGYDYGCVTNMAPGVPEGCLSGVTVGTSSKLKQFTLDLFLSEPVSEPAFMKPESAQVWVRLSFTL